MAEIKSYRIILEDSVSSDTETFTDPITDGKKANIKLFGAAFPGSGWVELHWGDNAGGWQFIRAIADTTYEFKDINEQFEGNGVKMFRVTRSKSGGGGNKAMKVWFRAMEGVL